MSRRTALVIISHDRRFLSTLSRSTVWLDRGQTRRIERGFAHFEEWRDEVLAEEERDQHKLDRKIVAEEHWLRYGVTGRRKRNMRRVGLLAGAARTAPHPSRQRRQCRRSRPVSAAPSGALVIEAKDIGKSYGGRADRRRFLDPHPARRPHRHCRAERQRQDHADQSADRCAAAGRRRGAAWVRLSPSRRSTSIATVSIRM